MIPPYCDDNIISTRILVEGGYNGILIEKMVKSWQYKNKKETPFQDHIT